MKYLSMFICVAFNIVLLAILADLWHEAVPWWGYFLAAMLARETNERFWME